MAKECKINSEISEDIECSNLSIFISRGENGVVLYLEMDAVVQL